MNKYYIILDKDGTLVNTVETDDKGILEGIDKLGSVVEINRVTYKILDLLEQVGEEDFATSYKNALFILHGSKNE